MSFDTQNSMYWLMIWIIAGITTGVILGWWQWISIKNLGKENSNRIINRLYVVLALRVLIVTGIALIAFLQGLLYGLSFLCAFFIGRWVWTYYVIKKNKKIKE